MNTRFAFGLLMLALVACGDVVKGTTVDAPPDPCPGAICECTAATEAMDCEEHEFCDESGGNRQCKCAPAYTANPDGGCVFANPIQDPGFQDPSKWTTAGGAMVIASNPGKNQPGELVFDKMAICQFGSVKQTVNMPPFERADRLKLTITHTVTDPNGDFFGFNQRMQIAFGNQWIEYDMYRGVPNATHRTTSFCLGPAAFGGPRDLRIHNVAGATCTPTSMGLHRIDEVKLEVAEPGECPNGVGVVNGNFQLATGWAFPSQQSGSGQILANIGENASFAAQLSQPNRCSEVRAIGTIAIPAADKVEHPALDIYWNGTSGARLAVSLFNKGIGTLNANGQIKHSRLCIPKWATGNVSQIQFHAQRVSDNGCATALNRTFILDNMTIVDEPACGTLADITDPSFERVVNPNGPMPGIALTNAFVNDLEGARAFVLNSPGNAKSGTGVLRTHNSNPCVFVGAAGGDLAFVVPSPNGSAGPAVKFAARADAGNVNSESRAVLQPNSPGFPTATVVENGQYNTGTLCIPPAMAGRLLGARFSTGDPDGGGCAPTAYDEIAFWDDIEVTTDASCPAQ